MMGETAGYQKIKFTESESLIDLRWLNLECVTTNEHLNYDVQHWSKVQVVGQIGQLLC